MYCHGVLGEKVQCSGQEADSVSELPVHQDGGGHQGPQVDGGRQPAAVQRVSQRNSGCAVCVHFDILLVGLMLFEEKM